MYLLDVYTGGFNVRNYSQGGSILNCRPLKRNLVYIVIATAFLLAGNCVDLLHADDTSSESKIKPASKVVRINKEDAAQLVSNKSCLSCHNTLNNFSHPIDVTPSMDLPKYFPLSDTGNLNCQTCHENTSEQDHIIADSTKTGKLRGGKSDRSFCLECHESQSNNTLNMHALVLTRAHPEKPDNRIGISSNSHEEVSYQTCLTCHDGSVATDAGYGMGMSDDPLRRARGILTAHPVDVEYKSNNSQQSGSNLRPVFNLDKRIRLEDNKVTCSSCHNLYSRENNLLVMSNKKSVLCLSCHKY